MLGNSDICDLLCAIAQRPTANTDQQITDLALKLRDWDALFRLAEEHRVVPLLFSRLTQARAPVPVEVQARLDAAYQRNVFHCMANAVELIALLKALEDEAVPAMPFKGIVLAASVYGSLTARTSGDLDLLIHSCDLEPATAILLKRGYELSTPVRADGSPAAADSYEYHFERRRDGMVTELRWRLELMQPRFRGNLGMDWTWPRRRTALLAGAQVPDMDPETTLLMLCMHGSKHYWTRLAWIVDVAQLLASRPGLNWREVSREARRTGLGRSLSLGVLLAHRVAGAEVSAVILRRFESDRGAQRLARHFEATLFAAPGSAPAGRVPYNIQLLGWRDRVRLLFSLSFLKPNQHDIAALDLPRPLHLFYYFVRPLRVLLDRSPR